jgi:hypothetical protein
MKQDTSQNASRPGSLPVPSPGLSTAELLAALHASGKALHEWGTAIDGTPLLAARTGGDKQPAIFITAGAHCTEVAGVHAALNLLTVLDTEHEVHILPLRDPFGFSGANHCLSFAAGEPVQVDSHQAALDYLLIHGQLLWQKGEMRLFKLGDMGFVWHAPKQPSEERFVVMDSRLVALAQQSPDVVRPLWGKRVMFLNDMRDVEGVGELGRCWHGVFSDSGERMGINRFFGRDDAPPEVAAVDLLMQTVCPGLTCDLHEGPGKGFWMPIPGPEKAREQVFEMTKAYLSYINACGYPITSYEEWVASIGAVRETYTFDWMKPEPRLPGMFWCDGLLRNEGYNMMDYGSLYGIGYGTEAPMVQPLDMRVDGITNGLLAAIKVWEQTV